MLFSCQLISLGNGDFDAVFRYENINWTTGDASGGSNGLGGRRRMPATLPVTAFTTSSCRDQVIRPICLRCPARLATPVSTGSTCSRSTTAASSLTALTTSGHIVFTDPDDGDVHSISNVNFDGPGAALGTLSLVKDFDTNDASHAGQFTWTYSVAPASLAFLAAGETRTESFDVTIADGHGGSVVQTVAVTLTGVNDPPVVTGVVQGSATEGQAAVTLDAFANASDPDDGAVLSVTGLPDVLPAGVTFDAETHSFTLDPSNVAYQHLAAARRPRSRSAIR